MRDHERELREALQARAGAVPVGRADEPGLLRRLAAARRRRRQAGLAGVAAVLVVMLSAVALVSADGPDRDTVIAGPDTSSTTTADVASTTTVDTVPVETTVTVPAPQTTTVAPGISASPTTAAAAVPRTTTTVAPLPPVPDDAVWPPPGSTTTFSTSEKATSDFARRFLGMGNPQLSPGRPSAAGNDAVDVRPLPGGGPTTTVLLRRVDGRGWVVLGSRAERILVSQPAVDAAVSSPLTVRGEAWTFEGNVIVQVRRDGASVPLGESFGTGGGDQMVPFEATVPFTRPSAARGTVVALEPRVDDGDQGPAAATVIRIRF